MINEYFIEPSLIYKWALCPMESRFFLDAIGVGKPRLLSSFPRSKPSKLKGVLLRGIPDDMPEIAKIRVDEFVNALTQEAITREVSADVSEDWCEAAKAQCVQLAPDVVIACEGDSAIGCWLTEADAFKNDSHFVHPTQLTPERTLEAFTASAKNLLRYSNRILIADPYLYKSAGIDTVKAFIKQAFSERVNDKSIELQLLFDASRSTKEYLLTELASTVADYPVDLKVLPINEKGQGEKLHNRYLLSELGGISFGVGTDASEDYHTDDLFLLDKATHTKRWNQYWNAAAFDIEV